MIQIETVSNGVLFNGSLTDKRGWVLSPSSDRTKVVLTNRITGLSNSSEVTEVEVDGNTFADYDALVAALGSVLFRTGSPSPGTEQGAAEWGGITGALSNQTDLQDVLNGKATLAQLDSSLESKVDKEAGKGLSEENFTTDEKLKLSGLESPKFKGQFLSLADLISADVGEVGGYAYVDGGVGGTVDLYIWDAVNSLWELVAGESTAETPASIKSKYESNPDTNAFTDDEKSKLASITSAFTTVLKTAYDNAVSWITANGANILNHLSNKSNPHDVTASQVGLGNVDNTKDIDKPMSTATKNYVDSAVGKVWAPDYSNMEATNRITYSGGSWTSDRRGFVYVLSRGYNSGIYNTQVAFINEKEVGRVWVEATSGTGTARSGSFANIYPVKAGDVIKLYGNLEVKCLFIPGVWV